MTTDCYSCQQESRTDLPPREAVVVTPCWRVAHAFNSALPGWLVVLPRRHVLSMAELTEPELAELGPLVGGLSRALADVVGCEKTYVMQFSEAEGFTHLHIHLVPRMPDQPEDVRGPRVFEYLRRPEAEWVPPVEMDRVCAEVGALAYR
jgi:diadenosine tetraphosphate (Ap4A) HIT family hydrolase